MLLDISSKLNDYILESQGTQLALQSCIGGLTRALGQLRRHTESLCRKLEGLVHYEIRTIRAETEEDITRLSHVVSSTKEIAMMNKLQLELLANDFNHHSTCTTAQSSSVSASSCSTMMDITTEEEKADDEITTYIQNLQIRQEARERGAKLPLVTKKLSPHRAKRH